MSYHAGDLEYTRRTARLPHSCDFWVIGGPDEIRALITDLGTALRAMEHRAAELAADAGPNVAKQRTRP